jgi:hypothetical protein
MYKYGLLFAGCAILLLSCRKHEDNSNQLGKILSSDAYALVVPDSADKSGSKPLYKFTDSEQLEVVKFIAKDGSDMGDHYIPEGVFELGNDYALLTLSLNHQTSTIYESYLIRYIDGIAYQLSPEFHPMKLDHGNWINDYAVKSIKKGTDVIFYCLTNNQLQRINLLGNNRFEFKSIDIPGITSNNFDVDYQGHAMIGNTFIISPDTILTTNAYENGNTLILKASDCGFNLIKLLDGAIRISHLYLQDNQLKEDTLSTLSQDNSGWQFLSGLSFPEDSLTLAVFDKAIINISSSKVKSKVKITSLDLFNMKSISLTDQSLTRYYLVGTDLSDRKVFLQLDPSKDPPTYSQLVVPNLLDVKKIHVTGNNVVTVFAIKFSDKKQIFRRFQSGTLKDVQNYQNISTRQVFTIK